MAAPKLSAAGGLPAMLYILKMVRRAGGLGKLYGRLRSRNACKTCAFGMGGQAGGMVNEAGSFPEVCKKSMQAQASDMAGAIPESFFRETSLDSLRKFTPRELEHLGRIPFPLLAEPGTAHFKRITWEEALDRTGDALKAALPQETFFYVSGRSSNEAAFLLQLTARAFGTNNIHNCSYYCHSASGVALSQVYGSGTASVVLEDLEKADLAIIAGANPASNHPRLITQLVHLRRRGGKILVINPLKELGLVRFRLPSDPQSMVFGSQVSDLYLQPNIGGDAALFKALLKGVLDGGGLDETFIREHTTGWETVKADLNAHSFEELLNLSGVPRVDLDQAVSLLLKAKRGIFAWAMGLTHHEFGVDAILSLTNLALARGWLGKEGCGLLPIRGHSNVQGVGSMGVSPGLKKAFAARLQDLYGITVPETPGQDTYASMVAAKEGRIKAAVLLGGNLFGSNPDRTWAAEALSKVGSVTFISTTLNEGHLHGLAKTAIILPALARDEEPEATTQESMFNYVRLSEGGHANVSGEMRSEVAIIADLAERLLPPGRFEWKTLRSHKTLREHIAEIVPGYAPLGEMDHTLKEFQIEGRTFHTPTFPTSDGKARFAVPVHDALKVPEGHFRLMTIRSEGQFNTVVYEEEDLYRGNLRRDVVMMSGADAKRLGVTEGSRVEVISEAGKMVVSVAIVDISSGNLAMYYPEANALVPRRLDSRSHTPAFKSVIAKVAKKK